MPNGEFAMKDKIDLMAQSLSSELKSELYPEKLGQRIMMQAPELRLTVLAKYEGMGIVLKKLGADVTELEAMIEEEGNKTVEGKY